MGRLIEAIGISALALGVVGGITAGAVGTYSLLMPGEYKIEQRRGSSVVYNRQGEVFVKAEPLNMLNYLAKEDPDKLRYALESLDKGMNSSKSNYTRNHESSRLERIARYD